MENHTLTPTQRAAMSAEDIEMLDAGISFWEALPDVIDVGIEEDHRRIERRLRWFGVAIAAGCVIWLAAGLLFYWRVIR